MVDPTSVTKLLRPVYSKYPVSSGFGYRIHPHTGIRTFHDGIDFACPIGTPVFACADGYVAAVKSKDDKNGAGNRIWLRIKGYRAMYFHLDDDGFRVKVGDNVKRGDLVAFSGNTGLSKGPHLHFELLNSSTYQPVEPIFEDKEFNPNETPTST